MHSFFKLTEMYLIHDDYTCIYIQVNIFFLLAALRSVYRQRKSTMQRSGKKESLQLFSWVWQLSFVLFSNTLIPMLVYADNSSRPPSFSFHCSGWLGCLVYSQSTAALLCLHGCSLSLTHCKACSCSSSMCSGVKRCVVYITIIYTHAVTWFSIFTNF